MPETCKTRNSTSVTIDEYIKNLEQAQERLQDQNLLFLCFSDAHAIKQERIFVKGRTLVETQTTVKRYTSEFIYKIEKGERKTKLPLWITDLPKD